MSAYPHSLERRGSHQLSNPGSWPRLYRIASFVGLGLGAALVGIQSNPLWIVITVGIPLLLFSPFLRLVFVVFGGIVVLQASQDLSTIKQAYLAGVLFCLTVAVVRLMSKGESARLSARPVFGWSIGFAAYLALTLVLATAHSTPFTAWLRDVSPYMLFAAVPLLAADAQSAASGGLIELLLVLAGSLAALSFAVQWLGSGRHQFAVLPVERLFLASFMLAAALYCFALAMAVVRGKWLPWLAVAAGVGALTVLAGSRSGLVLLLGLPITLGLVHKTLIRKILLLVGMTAVVMLIAAVVFFAAVAVTGADSSSIASRFEALPTVISTPETDASYRERYGQTVAAWRQFLREPFLGTGPGYIIPDAPITAQYTAAEIAYNLDTPALIASKFGIIGILLLASFGLAILAFLRATVRLRGNGAPVVATGTFLIVALIWSVNSPAFQDKGFALGLLLLMTLAMRPAASGHEAVDSPAR